MIIDIEDKLLFLGTFKRAKGIKGHLRYSSIEELNNLSMLDRVVYKEGSIYYLAEIESLADTIKIKNIDSIEDAQKLTGLYFYAIKQEKMPLFKNSYIGADIYCKGSLIGRVKEISITSMYDLLHISGRDIVIPFIDEYIKSINIDKNIIEIYKY